MASLLDRRLQLAFDAMVEAVDGAMAKAGCNGHGQVEDMKHNCC